jgi:DNA replication protein DnaC
VSDVELERKLRVLRLSGFVEALPVRTAEGVHNNLAHVEFLELLVEDELARLGAWSSRAASKPPSCPALKSLESLDWGFNPSLPKALILNLATLRFIGGHGGARVLGPAGVGKSHLRVSLAVRRHRGRLHHALSLGVRSGRGPRGSCRPPAPGAS